MKKRVLVTGGAGFIGSHVCERLLKHGHTVIALDNFSTGSLSNIDLLCEKPGFKFIEHDIIDPIDMEVDLIVNLACPASPPSYQKDPVHTVKSSVIGSINMLELAKKNQATIFQSSTSEVYGDPTQHPQKESYNGNVNCTGPRACYDEGKRCAETLFFDYHRMHNLNIKIARIFNTFGPRMMMDDGRVVSNFIVQALTGNEITIYGNGLQTRSFCYVDDLIDGIMAMLTLPHHHTGPVNLGNTDEITLIDLAKRILHLTGSRSRVVFKQIPEDDPQKRKPDIGRAARLLSWKPKVSLDSGLKKTIKFFREVLNQNPLNPTAQISP